jgi:hypothetical protein
MANLAVNRPRRSRFASPLQLSFEPILLAAHLLAQPNYGDNKKILSLLAQTCRQVVHHQDHWPCVVSASTFIKRIHSISTQCKLNIPRVLSKFQIIPLIELLPLASISWMLKLSIALLALIWIPPVHQFSIHWVEDEMPQAIGNCFLEMPKVVSAGSIEATLFVTPFLFLLFPSPGPWLSPPQ